MGEVVLIEPSFADLIAALEADAELPPLRRSHWLCSVRQIGKVTGKPLPLLPARWTSFRHAMARLHHARVGSTPKTLANHKANVRAALLWFGKEQNVHRRGAPLDSEWTRLKSLIAERRLWATLSGLMRFCSARGVPPWKVDDGVIDELMRYRAVTTALAVDAGARRAIARVWNSLCGAIDGWPCQRLTEPPIQPPAGPAWSTFPEGLRHGIERHLAGLGKPRRSASGRRIAPSKPSTIRTRRAELMAMTRMAARIGVPIESLTSLAALVAPDMAKRIVDAYWRKDGDEPKIFTIDLGHKILTIARETGQFSAADLEKLDDLRATLENYRRLGLTQKNLTLVRQVLTEGVWTQVLELPWHLMRRARDLKESAPTKAAVTAQLAIAIGILTVAPVRLGNLVRIRLGENLIKPGGFDSPYWLVFPHYDVKNRIDLNFKFDDVLTTLIDEYVHDFRPTLLRGANDSWLFPGESGGYKGLATLSSQVTQRIVKATGLRITVHQFRHAAAAFYLKHHPGDYETVRRILGHHNIQTTVNFYSDLNTIQATEMFGGLIARNRASSEELSTSE